MFSIGEFSKITGLTVKTLRFYHERGVLVPAHIEAGSGYRYYDQRNVETARAVVALRDCGFGLDEIQLIIRDHADEADILGYLQQRKQSLRERIRSDRDLVSVIDRIIKNEQEARHVAEHSAFEVEEKDVPSILIAGIRMQGRYEDCGKAFAKLGRSIGRYISGKPLCLYYDDSYREDDADFEPCMPVKRLVEVDGIDVRKLDACRCACLVHRGPYNELGRSYERLIQYTKDKGYTIRLPTREVYVKGPGMIFKGNPKKYLTEIQFPIDGSNSRLESGQSE